MNEALAALRDIGFEEKEAKVDLSLVKLGDITALRLAKDSHIDRTSAYDVLRKLSQKGIVTEYVKNGTTQFHALVPDRLLLHLKEKYSGFERLIPSIEQGVRGRDAARCELFSGTEGLKTVVRDLVNDTREYKIIGIRKEYEEVLGFFFDQAALKVIESKMRGLAIVERGARFTKLKNEKYRYLEKKLLSPATTVIYNDVVIFFIWAHPYCAVRVTGKLFADAQKEYFGLLWGLAK